jgi:hypothetical protein
MPRFRGTSMGAKRQENKLIKLRNGQGRKQGIMRETKKRGRGISRREAERDGNLLNLS